MNIGLLNIRIMIQKNTPTSDEIGNDMAVWSDYYSCAATGGNESGTESEKAGQTVDNEMIAFTVRYCDKTKNLNATGYRVVFGDEIYDITHIDHMNFKRKSVKIWCVKARR